jgi:hypothetical protein
VYVIAAGVGLFTAIGLLRVVRGWSMAALVPGAYVFMILLSCVAPERVVHTLGCEVDPRRPYEDEPEWNTLRNRTNRVIAVIDVPRQTQAAIATLERVGIGDRLAAFAGEEGAPDRSMPRASTAAA